MLPPVKKCISCRLSHQNPATYLFRTVLSCKRCLICADFSPDQTRPLFYWRKFSFCLLKMLNDGLEWITVMFLSAVWTLVLTAPIHCRASIGDSFNISVTEFNYRFTKLFLWFVVRVKMLSLTCDGQGQNTCVDAEWLWALNLIDRLYNSPFLQNLQTHMSCICRSITDDISTRGDGQHQILTRLTSDWCDAGNSLLDVHLYLFSESLCWERMIDDRMACAWQWERHFPFCLLFCCN